MSMYRTKRRKSLIQSEGKMSKNRINSSLLMSSTKLGRAISNNVTPSFPLKVRGMKGVMNSLKAL
jgi:hypothetical protein